MRVSLKSVSGVDSVDVSLENGLAVVKMKAGNTATLKQLNEAITKNGFTMKDSRAVLVGTVTNEGDGRKLHVSGTSDVLQLVPQSGKSDMGSLVGKTVVVEGIIPETAKGKAVDSIRYQSITEEEQR